MKRDVQQYNIEKKEFEKEMNNDGGNGEGGFEGWLLIVLDGMDEIQYFEVM